MTVNDLFLSSKQHFNKVATTFMSLVVFGLAFSAFHYLEVPHYETFAYYQKFAQLATGKLSRQAYADSFNVLVEDNTQVNKLVNREKEIFIWGTNPMLYALSKTTPPTRFVVLFHIEDVNAYDEVYQDLTGRPPRYIVVMKDANPMPSNFVDFVNRHYIPNYQFDHFVLWRKIRN